MESITRQEKYDQRISLIAVVLLMLVLGYDAGQKMYYQDSQPLSYNIL